MFIVNCPRHGSRVLLSERRIRSLRNTEAGILLDVECYCGEHVLLLTGRRSADPSPRQLTPSHRDPDQIPAQPRDLASAGAQ